MVLLILAKVHCFNPHITRKLQLKYAVSDIDNDEFQSPYNEEVAMMYLYHIESIEVFQSPYSEEVAINPSLRNATTKGVSIPI